MHVTGDSAARRLARSVPVHYMVFDLLWLDGHSLMRLPYEERRARLLELGLNGERWQTPDHVVGNGAGVLAASAAQGLEGVMAKKLGSTYEPGRRSRDWVKVKNKQRDDVTIVGWLPGEGRRRDRIGALLVARDGRYCGRVGTGFDDAELERLSALLTPIERGSAPIEQTRGAPREAIWVDPRYVCEVEFGEWTADGMLRHPSYKGLKERDDALVERPDLKFSNLDKVLYPAVGFTKGQVIDYYRAIAPAILPHLAGRPLTRKRYPNGVEGQFFYEKNCPSHRPDWVKVAPMKMSSKTIEFCLCEDISTLVWLANLAALELHSSLSLAEAPQRPTLLVFDLDPGEPATIVECCRVGLWLQGMFERLGLQAFAKTSGSKGLQVYVPLNVDDVGYEGPRGTKTFAKAVAELLEQSEPDLVVSRMTKALRPGKVFVDWSQNDDVKTTVNVYSLRAKERPTVSTPVTWDEVRACLDAEDPELLVFTADQVVARVARDGDLFAPVLSLTQELPSL
jgi:bifunctional non-homologous end joining protein LigD